MTVGATNGPNPIESDIADDLLYQEAMAHMQDGAWPQAIESFSTLVRNHPHEWRFQNGLEMAQFKADVDASSNVRAKRWIVPGPRALLPLLVMVVIALLLFYSVRFITDVLIPILEERQQTERMNTAVAEANTLLEKDLFVQARTKLQDGVINQQPSNPEQERIHNRASGLLATIDLVEQRFNLYNEAKAFMANGEYGTAAMLFKEIVSKQPDYKDAAKLLAEIDGLAKLLELYLQADLLYKEGPAKRLQTITVYESLRELDKAYQKDEVEARLSELYLAEAQSILALEPAAPDRLPEVISYLEELAKLAPRQEPGWSMLRVAVAYQAGADASVAANWQLAIDKLEEVFAQEPDYLGGNAVELLYTALVSRAGELQANGETEEANALYARAKELPVRETGQAEDGLAQTESASTLSNSSEASAVVNVDINMRSGPGVNYGIIGGASQGTRFPITGKNPAGDWWQINYNGQRGWLFGQLVTAENTTDVPVITNIPPAPTVSLPPPANTPVPAQPTATPQPVSSYKFNVATVVRCDPNAGITYVQGRTRVGGQAQSGDWSVAFSYAPDGPIVAQIQAGPHPGYNSWDQGFYSHILQADGPRAGNWFFWVVDPSGKRISELANVQTDGPGGNCQNAVIDFDSR